MANKVRFAFTEVDSSLGALSALPYLPLTLTYRKFGLKPRPFRTALSYNGKSDNQAKN
jgi:hypothetical protein